MTSVEITTENVWEDFINGSKIPVSFFQSWNWGEFEKKMGTRVFRLGFIDNDKLTGVAQTFLYKARRGRFLHVRNGPVLKWDDPEVVYRVLDLIKDFAQNLKCDYIRISPLVNALGHEENLLRQYGFKNSQMHDVDAEITWVLDLEAEPDDILSGMRKTTRYLIKKAVKDGQIEIIKTVNPDDLKHFWAIYEHTVKRQGWHAYTYNYIETEFNEFAKDGMSKLMLARYRNQYIAASIFIYYQNEVYYHHSGSLAEYHKIPAMYLLQWESILEAKKIGMKKYNFFGIARNDNPKHPWHGLSLFKKGFGGHEEIHMHAKDFPLRPRYWLTHYYEKLEKWKRGYT